MSHISNIQTLILDLDGFEAACRERGLELKRGQKQHRTYGGQLTPCEHAVIDPNNSDAYELGLIRARFDEKRKQIVADPKGPGWMIAYDNWAGGKGMMEKVGDRCGGLLQNYGVQAAKRKAKKLGWQVKEAVQADGSIRLTCTPKPQFGQQAAASASW